MNTSKTLLKIVKNPPTDHLPLDSRIIGLSTKGKEVNFRDYVEKDLD